MSRYTTDQKGVPAHSLLSPQQMQDVLLLVVTALVLYLCGLLVRPFLAVITWAFVLAVVAEPWHSWLEGKIQHRNLAAAISVAVVVGLLVTPGVYIMQRLYQEVSDLVHQISIEANSGGWRALATPYPQLAFLGDWIEARLDVDEAGRQLSGWLASRAPLFFSRSVWALTQVVFTLLALYYFFRDRKKLLGVMRRLVPLSEQETDAVFKRVSETIYASLYGNIAVKLAQGVLGGLMFWILGLPAPALCGAAMALAAVLPIVGTSLLWGPAVVLLAIQGSWIKALTLAGWGVVVISQIDNFLYPMLVARELRFHPLAVLFAVFGGLIAFGVSGVVLGPVILAVTLALLEVWRLRAVPAPSKTP